MNRTLLRRAAASVVLASVFTAAAFADDQEATRPRTDPSMQSPDVPGNAQDRAAQAVTGNNQRNANEQRAANPQRAQTTVDQAVVDSIILNWPERPRLGAAMMIAQYGQPQEATPQRLIWHNAGQFKRISVLAEERAHDFPLPHTDFLEHTIAYKVPADKVDEVVALDGSTTVNRTAGELSARCDLEAHNILTFNLTHDVITGKKSVEQARKEFADTVVQEMTGQQPKYVQSLQFDVHEPQQAMFVDESLVPGSPVRAEDPNDGVQPYDGDRGDQVANRTGDRASAGQPDGRSGANDNRAGVAGDDRSTANRDSNNNSPGNTANASDVAGDRTGSGDRGGPGYRGDLAGGQSAGEQPQAKGGDAEILAIVMAIDHNEVFASLIAQKKELSPQVMEFARMLNREHGQNMVKGAQLGQQIGVRPVQTAHVDLMKRKGAADLANIVRLDGPSFEVAFLDAMIKGHENALAVIDANLKSVKNDQLKQHLTTSREHVAHHLEQARSLRGNVR
jgi:predicted outer membrane protein